MNGRRLAKQLTTFVVSQFDGNAIANANNEPKPVPVRDGAFVHVMSRRGNYLNGVVLVPSTPPYARRGTLQRTRA